MIRLSSLYADFKVRSSECMIGNKFNLAIDADAVLCQAKYLKERFKQEGTQASLLQALKAFVQ